MHMQVGLSPSQKLLVFVKRDGEGPFVTRICAMAKRAVEEGCVRWLALLENIANANLDSRERFVKKVVAMESVLAVEENFLMAVLLVLIKNTRCVVLQGVVHTLTKPLEQIVGVCIIEMHLPSVIVTNVHAINRRAPTPTIVNNLARMPKTEHAQLRLTNLMALLAILNHLERVKTVYVLARAQSRSLGIPL